MEAAGERPVEVTVSHLAGAEPAAALADGLTERLRTGLGPRAVAVTEVAGVLGAHVGPGLVGVTVVRIGA